MQILIMGLQILTPSCAIVWISQYENCQFRFSKAGNPFWSVMPAFFFFYYWCIQSSCYGLLICCFIIHSIFFSAGPFTFQCTLHKNGTIWFAYQTVIAFHHVLLITWKYWDGPSVATPISSLILLPLPLSVHSCHLCLNPFTLLKLSVFSHPIILGLSHSDFSVPILSFTLILLPPVHLLTTLPPYFHGSSPHDQWYEVITLPSVLLFPPTPPYTTTSLSSNLPPCFTAHPPLYSCRHTCSCTRKLLICGGVDDFWYQ